MSIQNIRNSKNSVGPASNKQDQAFNGLHRAGQLQNVFLSIATYIFLNVNTEYKKFISVLIAKCICP